MSVRCSRSPGRWPSIPSCSCWTTFEGLSPAIIPALGESLAAITRLGMSLVIAESNIHHVPAWTRRLYVIERGEVIFAGPPDDARRDAAVLRVIGGKAS